MIRGPKRTVTVLLPLELYDRLKAFAEADRRSLSGEIRQILKGYVEYMDRGGVSWCGRSRDRGVERYPQRDGDSAFEQKASRRDSPAAGL